MPRSLKDHATSVANACGGVGLDPITIISIVTALLPALLNCLKPPTPAALAVEITSQWDPQSGYKPSLVNRVANHTIKTAKKKGTKLNKQQAREIAIAVLDDARQAPEQEVQAFGATQGAW